MQTALPKPMIAGTGGRGSSEYNLDNTDVARVEG